MIPVTTSSTDTGWNFVDLEIKGSTGLIEAISENCPKKLSPCPNNSEGLSILALGKFSNNLLSPEALLDEYILFESSDTPNADTWTKFLTLYFEDIFDF